MGRVVPLGFDWASATPAGLLGLVVMLVLFGVLQPRYLVNKQLALMQQRLDDSQRREAIWQETVKEQAKQLAAMSVVGDTITRVLAPGTGTGVPGASSDPS
jgi:hypothetical protein